MLTFLADARNGSSAATACGSFCCERVSARPGETNKIAINYANWVAPIGGRGISGAPAIVVKNITPVPSLAPANQPPTNTDYTPSVAANGTLNGTVATNGVDPESQPLTYAHLALYGPRYGTLVFNANGTYVYTPRSGFTGYDTFWFSTSDGVNKPVVNRVVVSVNPPSPAPALPAPILTPAVWVDPNRIAVRSPVLEFPLAVSPAARPGDLYRLELVQAAVDCDGVIYEHQSCFDVTIGTC